LKQAGIRRISAEKEKVVLTFDSKSSIDPQRLVSAVARGKGRREFTPDQRLKLRLTAKAWEGMLEETKKLLMEIL
jgi:transcription-repair coupling factor (superfamily II helicase)